MGWDNLLKIIRTLKFKSITCFRYNCTQKSELGRNGVWICNELTSDIPHILVCKPVNLFLGVWADVSLRDGVTQFTQKNDGHFNNFICWRRWRHLLPQIILMPWLLTVGLLLKYMDTDREMQGTHTKWVIFVCIKS